MSLSSKSLLIKNGRLIDPASKLDAEMDILLRGGKVSEVAHKDKIRGSADEKFDARGLIVAPGFIDMHVHLREPGQSHKETIATGTQAAAAGGFTSVCAMPNTAPVNDSAEITAWMRAPERGAVVNVFPIAAAITDDGKPILEDAIMREVLRQAAQLGLPVIQHAEDTRLTSGAVMNAGPTAFWLGLRGMPEEAEALIVERDIKLAAQTKSHLHVAHISTAAALKAVRKAKREHLRVSCEITPHHFTLIDADLDADTSLAMYDSRFKMNPPLRSAADREAMLAALSDGAIDAIATDHAPHAAQEKNAEFDRAPFGITGLETALGLAISRLHREKRVPLSRLIELFATNPARL